MAIPPWRQERKTTEMMETDRLFSPDPTAESAIMTVQSSAKTMTARLVPIF